MNWIDWLDGDNGNLSGERQEVTEKRYSVRANETVAKGEGPEYQAWHAANRELDVLKLGIIRRNWRIWRHNDDGSVTDVTDGEPEEKWWQCNWNSDRGTVVCEEAETLIEGWWTIQAIGKEYRWVHANIRSATAPTPEQFQAHVLAETGVKVPCVEEAQWWRWSDREQEWTESLPQHGYVEVWNGAKNCRVYGTVSSRDEKRDALLAAAKAAGKPEDEA